MLMFCFNPRSPPSPCTSRRHLTRDTAAPSSPPPPQTSPLTQVDNLNHQLSIFEPNTMSDTRCKIQCIPNHHLCGQVGLRQVKWAALPQILSQGFRKDKKCNFRLKTTLVADEPSARQLMLRAVSPWERCRRGKSSTGGKCLSDLGLINPRTTRFKWNVTIFRTYDNLASYEPGNMEYRGRAYSTEVGAILVY